MKICEGKIQKEVIFIMRNSNKTREKITGVLIGLLLSALCVTPALAAGSGTFFSSFFFLSFKIFSCIFFISGALLLLASVFFLSEGEERLTVLLCALLLFCLSKLLLRIC